MSSPTFDVQARKASDDRPNRRWWGLILRFTVSLGLVAYLATRMEGNFAFDVLTELSWQPFLFALGALLLSQLLSARRWSGLARPVGLEASDGRFLKLYFEGMFFSLCLPSAMGGDAFKAYQLGRSKTTRVLAACTVLGDRLTGLLALATIACVAAVVKHYQLNNWQAALCAIGGVLVSTGGLAIGRLVFRRMDGWWRSIPKLEKAVAALQPYWDQPSVVLVALAYSFVIQILNVVTVALLGHALGIELPLIAYFIAVPLVALATASPISINGIGVREGGLAIMLAAYNLDRDSAVILGLSWTLIVMLCGLFGGVVYMLDSHRLPNEALAVSTDKAPQVQS